MILTNRDQSSKIVGRISASVIRHSAARGYNGGLRSANPPYRTAKPHLPRTDSAALTMLMVGFFPQ